MREMETTMPRPGSRTTGFRTAGPVGALAAATAVLLTTRTAHAVDVLGGLEAPFRAALESGNYAPALGLVFAAGLATSLTPCVYPMIVITVSVFGARQAKTRAEGAMLSTAFVLGIAAVMTPLGTIAGATGGIFGAALSNPFVLVGLAVLFLVLAAGMFGGFEMNLPASLQNRLAQVGGIGGKGAFALGMVSALIAAPCTGPVLAFLLTWIGTTGNVAFGALSMFVYALGLGLLFWVVGTFAVALPKSGRWLEWVKSVFGVVMVVMALYYLKPLLPLPLPVEKTQWVVVAGLVLLGAGLLGGAIHLTFHGPLGRRVRKGVAIGAAVAGSFLLVSYAEALPPGAKIQWLKDYSDARALAQAESRPLLVDFGADWCGACKELERVTFSDPRVVAACQARGFVPVHVDLTSSENVDENAAALDGYDQRGLPLVVFHDRKGDEIARITQFIPPEEMLALIAQLDGR
jgi:thiol:disulfide interchange protein DsbD